jgi:oligopeptide transport system substrate-binding protein
VHLRVNPNRNPTAVVALRRAIAMAIDREKLNDLFEGAYKPATSFVTPGMLGFSKTAGLAFNPEKARQELKKAGLNAALIPALDLLTVSFDDQIILAQFIQDQLKRNLGLNTRVHNFEPKRYYSPQLKHNDFAMQINFWGADFPDADSFYSIFLSNSGLNRNKWKNDEYDRLVTTARSLPDRKAREKAYLQAQKILLEDSVATIPMYYGQVFGLVRDNIHGFDPGPLNWWSFKDLSISPVK